MGRGPEDQEGEEDTDEGTNGERTTNDETRGDDGGTPGPGDSRLLGFFPFFLCPRDMHTLDRLFFFFFFVSLCSLVMHPMPTSAYS